MCGGKDSLHLFFCLLHMHYGILQVNYRILQEEGNVPSRTDAVWAARWFCTETYVVQSEIYYKFASVDFVEASLVMESWSVECIAVLMSHVNCLAMALSDVVRVS